MIAPEAPLELVFDALALERCFLAGEILQASRPAPLEYALLGLSTSERPLHVVATPLLPGQRVSEASVVQPAAGVVRLGSEIDALSARLQRRLLPIAFVHAHPGSCDASRVDLDFMTGPFVDQCSTAVSFEAVRAVGSGEPPCACPGLQRLWCSRVGPRELRVELGLCFSLIVNRRREHRLYAASRERCPVCGRASSREVAARLVAPDCQLSAGQRALLRARLAREIDEKIALATDVGHEVGA